MNEQQVKEFQDALRRTFSRMDFAAFREKTGFVGKYAQEKWLEWVKGVEGLCSFDAGTMAKILS